MGNASHSEKKQQENSEGLLRGRGICSAVFLPLYCVSVSKLGGYE